MTKGVAVVPFPSTTMPAPASIRQLQPAPTTQGISAVPLPSTVMPAPAVRTQLQAPAHPQRVTSDHPFTYWRAHENARHRVTRQDFRHARPDATIRRGYLAQPPFRPGRRCDGGRRVRRHHGRTRPDVRTEERPGGKQARTGWAL